MVARHSSIVDSPQPDADSEGGRWLAGVLSSSVDWEGGKAELWAQPAWGFNLTSISAALSDDGYETLSSQVIDP